MILKGKQLIKSYGDLNVLKGIDIGIEKGEIVCVIHRSSVQILFRA